MKHKLLAITLALSMLIGLLPVTALAEEGDTAAEQVVYTETGEEPEGNPAEPDEPDAGPAEGEDDTTVAAPEQEEPVEEPTAADQLQARIDVLPDAEELKEMDGDKQAQVYEEVSDIYDAIEELTADEAAELDTTALEEAAAFFTQQIMTLEEVGETPNYCGENVTWTFDEKSGTLTISGAGAMVNYTSAANQPWASQRANIKKLVVDSGVTSLGNYALSGASNLTEIEFAGTTTIQTIGKRALEKTGLTSVTIPDSVIDLQEQALGENTSLTSVQIGMGLSTCGNWVFYGDTALAQVQVAAGNSNFYSEDGVLFGREDDEDSKYHTIILYPSAKEGAAYSIPEGTVHIAAYAFQNCNKLTSLAIPSTLESYGSDKTLAMFQGTKNLKQIIVAENNPTYTIDDAGAWVSRDGKKIVLYPAASSRTTYTISENVTVIVGQAFAYAVNLETLYYNAKDASDTENFGAGARFSGAGATGGFRVVIGDSVEEIPMNMFSGSNVTEVVIGKSVKEIGANAFQNCSKLEEVTIPDSVEKINASAFANCISLKTLTLGSRLKTFSGDHIFYNCTALETVYYNIPALEKTTTPSTNNTFYKAGESSATGGVTVYVGEAVTNFSGLWDCQYVKKLVIEGSSSGCILTGSVGSAGLEELVISENVTDIPNNAFINNNNLKRIIFTGDEVNLTNVGTNAFCNESAFSSEKRQDILLILPETNNVILNYNWNNLQNHHNLRAFILNAAESDVVYIDLDNPVRDGYAFGGWYTDEDLVSKTDSVTNVGTYYAEWNYDDTDDYTVTDVLKFDSVEYGRTVEGQIITATLADSSAEDETTIKRAVSSNSDIFCVSEPDGNTVTVTPVAGLPAGKYEETIYVTVVKDYCYFVPVSLTVTPATLDAPELSGYTATTTSITVTVPTPLPTGASKVQYSIDGGSTWQDSNKFSSLTSGTSYSVIAKFVANNSGNYADSANSTELSAKTNSTGGGGGSHSGGGSSSSSTSTVSVDTAKNGSVSVSPKNASKGTTVTITAKPDKGYEVDEVTVTDKNGKAVKVTDKGNDKYTFTMPSGKVDVEVTFVKEYVAPAVSFDDVSKNAWYYDAAIYAAENGLMSGTGNGQFSPDMTTSRAMIWTTLARLDGQNVAVTSGNWYEKAQSWAVSRGVSDGTSPDAPITREQLAVMLYGFAKDQGYTTKNGVSLSRYTDASDVSPWAAEALEWAVGNGLISSMGNNILAPTGTATRAQVATILMRFVENLTK